MRYQDREVRESQWRVRPREEYTFPSEDVNVFGQRTPFSNPNDDQSFVKGDGDDLGSPSLLPVVQPVDMARGSTPDEFRKLENRILELETSGRDHGLLIGLSDDDHPIYHTDSRGDIRYYRKTDFINSSTGIPDAGKPIVLDASGVIDSSMISGSGGGGETNTASNINTAGVGVWDQKVGVDLQFRGIKAEDTSITVTLDAANHEIDLAIVDSTIDHDALLNFVADEHVDHTGVTLTAGLGLSGGGDISANRTFTLDLNELSTATLDSANDSLVFIDANDSNTPKKTTVPLAMDEISVDLLSDVDTTTGAPSLNDVLKWNGTDWVPGTAGDTSEFTFSIVSFAGSGVGGTSLIGGGASNPWKAIGAISFTASYNNAPGGMTAEVAQAGSATPWAGNLSMTPVTGPETNTEAVDYPSSATGTITFTLSQSADASTAQDSHSFSNTMRYGNSTLTIGNQTEASLEALTEVSGPNESRTQTINNIATTANQLVFAYADRLSDVQQVQIDTGFGFVTASFASAATTVQATVQTGVLNVTNSLNFDETFACVTSRTTGLADGTNDFRLRTNTTAQNYIFWGELAKDSGANDAQVYTEADVENNTATEPGQVASNTMSSRSMTVNATASEYTYIAYPSRMGALTSIVIGGFESLGDFWWDAGVGTELSITNDGGFTENYYVYVSKNPGFTDPTTMTVTI